jgi:hypothetical protein
MRLHGTAHGGGVGLDANACAQCRTVEGSSTTAVEAASGSLGGWAHRALRARPVVRAAEQLNLVSNRLVPAELQQADGSSTHAQQGVRPQAHDHNCRVDWGLLAVGCARCGTAQS